MEKSPEEQAQHQMGALVLPHQDAVTQRIEFPPQWYYAFMLSRVYKEKYFLVTVANNHTNLDE